MEGELSGLVPGMISALLGAGGAGWLVRILLGRMIVQYDKKHDAQIKNLDALAEKYQSLITRIAVTETILHEMREGRYDIERRVGELQGQQRQALKEIDDDIRKLHCDINVAHERIRHLMSASPRPGKLERK